MVCQLIQDHPRRCGENKEAQAIKVLCTGSPPQVRGKLLSRPLLCFISRITPAGAGKTKTVTPSCMEGGDHPRRCGENDFAHVLIHRRIGSPPQVRGKLFLALIGALPQRITPAGAGKTERCNLRHSVLAEDHPRRCGENICALLHRYRQIGSPPQVRGKPDGVAVGAALERITPAGAGKTIS